MKFGERDLDLSKPWLMGVLNVTPDSFSDGGRYLTRAAALEQARAMAAAGATLIDIGGESTRPGAASVTVQEELDRVCPVVEAIAGELDVVISVDTSTPEVMQEAVRLGARMINDVRALTRPGALHAAAKVQVPVCLMHMQGEPGTMQQKPQYLDVVQEVAEFLLARVRACNDAGIPAERILLDPGFGFGKTLEHNLMLMQKLEYLSDMGFPLLVGVSRKSMIGALTDRPVAERAAGSAAAAAIAVLKGAAIIRAHDVRENLDAIKVASAIRGVNNNG